MKITTNKETMMTALGRTTNIAMKKGTMPILSTILFEKVSSDIFSVTATDLEMFSEAKYDAIIEGEGSFCVNADDMFKWVKSLPSGNIVIEHSTNGVKISTSQTSFNMVSISGDEFPRPDVSSIEGKEVDKDSLLNLFNHTLFCVADNDPRLFLNGINFEPTENGVRCVSTDGHRLAKIDVKCGDIFDKTVIIPKKGVVEIKSLLESDKEQPKLALDGPALIYTTPNLSLSIRLIEGDFPDYNMVIPKDANCVAKVNKSILSDALKRASLVAVNTKGVKMTFDNDNLTVQASDADRGDGNTVIDCEYSSDKIEMGFNASYFIDVLNVIEDEFVYLNLTDELSPCVVTKDSEENFLTVIMPVRIN